MSRPARKQTPDAAHAGDKSARPVTIAHPANAQPSSELAPTQERDMTAPDSRGRDRAPPQQGSTLARFGRGFLKALLPFVMVAIGLAGYKYLKATRPEAAKRPQMERAFAVETVIAQRMSARPTLTLYGNTVSGRQVDIRALVAGRVVATHDELREGGRITAGDTLLAIDAFEYKATIDEAKAQRTETAARLAEQQASLTSDKTSLGHAEAQLALAKADAARAEKLVGRGNLPERSLDDRRQAVLQRRQTVDQLANSILVWEARIAQTKATAERLDVAIARAEKRLSETELKAPFDAYVTEVAAQVGRMMSVNDKVATLIDQSWIEAQFSLTDSQFGRIVARDGKLEGREVEVNWTLGGETFAYKAEISRIAARISSISGGIDVFARIIDPMKPVPLRPGAFVELQLDDIQFNDVVRVPNTALYEGDTVFAVTNERLDPRKVEVAGTSGSEILIRGPIKDGDEIVITRMSTPGKGVLIKRAPTAPTKKDTSKAPVTGGIRQSKAQ